MKKILTICGTRPEGIKLAPVIKELRKHPDQIKTVVCVTGQHREMLDQALNIFKIIPDCDLHLMQPNQSLSELTARLITGVDRIVNFVKPDWILAQGDSTTAFVAALASYYHKVKFGHIEAGLRTGDKFTPYPEEMFRRMADYLADTYFAPTQQSRQNLLSEGVPKGRILVTGNTGIDALLEVAARPYDWKASQFASLHGRIVLVTAHRRESFDMGLHEICLAIQELAKRFSETTFIYPVHLNPNVQEASKSLLNQSNVTLTGPLDYVTMVQLMKRSKLILSDSGGLQEEAPTFHVPLLVMRDRTERPEGITANVARLVGVKHNRIIEETTRLLTDPEAYASMTKAPNPYGDGHASQRIVSHLLREK